MFRGSDLGIASQLRVLSAQFVGFRITLGHGDIRRISGVLDSIRVHVPSSHLLNVGADIQKVGMVRLNLAFKHG